MESGAKDPGQRLAREAEPQAARRRLYPSLLSQDELGWA